MIILFIVSTANVKLTLGCEIHVKLAVFEQALPFKYSQLTSLHTENAKIKNHLILYVFVFLLSYSSCMCDIFKYWPTIQVGEIPW